MPPTEPAVSSSINLQNSIFNAPNGIIPGKPVESAESKAPAAEPAPTAAAPTQGIKRSREEEDEDDGEGDAPMEEEESDAPMEDSSDED